MALPNTPASPAGDALWLRAIKLLVVPELGATAIDLSEMRITFRVIAADMETPGSAIIRVFNLSWETAAKVEKEGAAVLLQAGYQQAGPSSIFNGTIKQIRRGRLNPTDTFLDIYAGDGDLAYNMAWVNRTLEKGSTPQERLDAAAAPMGDFEVDQGFVELQPKTTGAGAATAQAITKLPRGKVMYGLSRQYIRDLSTTQGCDWSIQDGKLQIIPAKSYKPGEAVVLNYQSGLVGIPEQTQDGLHIKCLLNPLMKIGGLINIETALVNRTTSQRLLPDQTLQQQQQTLPAPLSPISIYRIYALDHEGDTRGNPWYTTAVCLALARVGTAGAVVQETPPVVIPAP